MVRPRKYKLVNFEPSVTYFKPKGIPLVNLEEIEITIDELETLRLSDYKKMNQTNSAKEMEIHQSTFQRTLTRAREKISDALINGKAIKIHGGEYKMPNRNGMGPLGMGPMTGRGLGPCGRGMGNKQNLGQGFGRGFRQGFGRDYDNINSINTQAQNINQNNFSKEQEKTALKEELLELELEEKKLLNEKELIKKKLEEINS
jgi:predicted DNA-binding protein (UPF0251 family)